MGKKTKAMPSDDQMMSAPTANTTDLQEQMGEDKAPPKAARETRTWFMILNQETADISLLPFNNKTELRLFLKEKPHCTVHGEIAVRGYLKPLKVTQEVRF